MQELFWFADIHTDGRGFSRSTRLTVAGTSSVLHFGKRRHARLV